MLRGGPFSNIPKGHLKLSHAPKGQLILAQGNALGRGMANIMSPERAAQKWGSTRA